MSYKKQRQRSSIYNLRIFHNWVKRQLIGESAVYLKENYDMQNQSLLDLAAGRGGDMHKWYDSGIYRVSGIDIDKKSIETAKERYSKFSRRKQPAPNYKFFVYDLSNPRNIPHITHDLRGQRYDIVSCQFAIHYFFASEMALDTLLRIVRSHIKRNGMFIGTTMSGTKVNEMFVDGNVIRKKLFYLENKVEIMDTYTPYGNKYIVSLGEQDQSETHYFVDKPSEEYMVDMTELKAKCARYGLMYIGETEFKQWYSLFVKERRDRMSPEEKEFSFLNFSFVFMAK